MVLGDRCLKSRCWQSFTCSEGSRKGFFLASSSFWWLPESLGIPWLAATLFQFWPLSSHDHFPSVLVHISVSSLLLVRTQVMLDLGLTVSQHDLILLHLQRPYFQIRPYSHVPEVRTSTYLLRGHATTHNTILLRLFSFHICTNRTFLIANDRKHKLNWLRQNEPIWLS